jgi:hypothetical protein
VNAYFDKDSAFLSKMVAAAPECLFFISAISLGEIETSYLICNRDPDVIVKCKQFIRETFLCGRDENSYLLSIDERSRERYADVVSRLWKKNPPDSSKRRTEAHLVSVGVDVNDVWIFSTAWTYNLTLLTTDRMEVIRRVVPEVTVENWLVPERADTSQG